MKQSARCGTGAQTVMLEELKRKVLAANLLLPKFSLVTFTWGNVSELDRERGLVVIKPSGVAYEDMEAEQMVVVELDTGKIAEGRLAPSSDTPTHLALYKEFPDAGGVVHTHSRWATVFAQAGAGIPLLGTTHADYFHGEIPCTRRMTEDEITGDYEANTGKVIAECFRNADVAECAERAERDECTKRAECDNRADRADRAECDSRADRAECYSRADRVSAGAVQAALVHGHGPFVWGADAEEALHNAVVLEEIAFMAWHTLALNPEAKQIQQELMDKHYYRKHGPGAYYGQR